MIDQNNRDQNNRDKKKRKYWTDFEKYYGIVDLSKYQDTEKIDKISKERSLSMKWAEIPNLIVDCHDMILSYLSDNTKLDIYKAEELSMDFKRAKTDLSYSFETLIERAFELANTYSSLVKHYNTLLQISRGIHLQNLKLKKEIDEKDKEIDRLKEILYPVPKTKIIEKDRKKIERLYNSGKSVKELADKYNISAPYVYKILRETKGSKGDKGKDKKNKIDRRRGEGYEEKEIKKISD